MRPGGMPSAWHSYTCAPCQAALMVGGAAWSEITCPGCGRPMQRLAEHRAEAAP
jgi:ribosomal protein S27E